MNALPGLIAAARGDCWDDAARAIMTTDTFAKVATAAVNYAGKTVTINGIAKGSGMIAPDMATMLVFIFTDAAIPSRDLQKMLSKSVAESFNCITVDGDTSTSDTVLLFATGNGGPKANRMRLKVLRKPCLAFALIWRSRLRAMVKAQRSSLKLPSQVRSLTRLPTGLRCRLPIHLW